jgi:excisionase family DNA binding protein
MKIEPILYSVQEAAAKLCVAPKWLYERTRKNAIPYRRLGKYVRFSGDDLEAIVTNASNNVIIVNSDSINGDGKNERRPQGPNDAAGPR